MKKIVKPTHFLVFLVIGFLISVASCKEDTNCTVQVFVKTKADTNIVVPGAWVVISKTGQVGDSGVADGNGMYTHIFPLEAIMDVKAVDNSTSPPRIGTGSIRFWAGHTVRTSIFVQ
ncbi:MAG: hypothetical protein WCL51_07160 [Bacteroidota bacterium]